MKLHKLLATALVGAACMTGVTACGGDSQPEKISDDSFVDFCKKAIESDATLKANADEICPCVQKKLEDKGLGDKDPNDKAVNQDIFNASRDCTVESQSGS